MFWHYFRKKRIGVYHDILKESPLDPLNDKTILNRLNAIWSVLAIQDIISLNEKQQGLITVDTWHINCLHLIDTLKLSNKYIRNDQFDELLKTMENLKNRTESTLDMFLTNDERQIIDLKTSLVHLKGLLLDHIHLLKGKDGTSYQRAVVKIYIDITTLTYVLVENSYRNTH